MQFQQLVYFVAVAETRHFTRAAERVHVSQPSLSQQIRALENELGAQLVIGMGELHIGEAEEDQAEDGRGVFGRAQARVRAQLIGGVPQPRLQILQSAGHSCYLLIVGVCDTLPIMESAASDCYPQQPV